jgi:hypothetical protein
VDAALGMTREKRPKARKIRLSAVDSRREKKTGF